MNRFEFQRYPQESEVDYITRICSLKLDNLVEFTWNEIAALVNDELGLNYSESYYRKKCYLKDKHLDINESVVTTPVEEPSEDDNPLFELRKERIKLADERSQLMLAARKIAREETLMEIAKEVAEKFRDKPVLPNYEYVTNLGKLDAILQISDWHYGIEVNNPWNKYNPEIAKDRIIKLRSRVKDLIQKNGIKNLYITNLGDLISGRIHDTIRIQNRIDVITQCLEVAEILIEFLAYLSQYADIHYISTSDNHSRIEPKKESSLDLESLTRIIDPLVEARIELLQLKNKCKNVSFIKSPYGPDIAAFTIKNFKIGAVHGHKDSPKLVVNNISLMTRDNFDLALSAHLHHFSCDEQYNTVVVSNGSLMGVDDYAENLRVMSKPSQNLIILSEISPAESIHRIVLD